MHTINDIDVIDVNDDFEKSIIEFNLTCTIARTIGPNGYTTVNITGEKENVKKWMDKYYGGEE